MKFSVVLEIIQQLGEVRLEHLRQRKLMERDLAMDEIQKRRIKSMAMFLSWYQLCILLILISML